jgi:FtsP/CotA-like multicopper oxidase with cupredoxin domain
MTRIEHNTLRAGWTPLCLVVVASAAMMLATTARAGIIGETGTNFSLTATEGYISVSDGGSIYSWGYTSSGTMQLPGPTLIVDQGDMISITLTNNLPTAAGNVSIVFPGQVVSIDPADPGVAGDLMQEAAPGGTVTYQFEATNPGTYQYHSGTQPDLQVEMGLYGALIVRPAGFDPATNRTAYGDAKTGYDREYLYLLSEIDIDIHQAAELQAAGDGPIMLPTGAYHSEYWLMNGRAAPDTMAVDNAAVLPTQPYGSLTHMYPGEKLLLRVIGAGREMHPFHTHGNHARLLARDGRVLANAAGNLAGPLLFTIPSLPGGTADAIFEWTGKDLGWDMYGHADPGDGLCVDNNGDGYDDDGVNDNDWEWCPDHGKPIPVTLPAISSLAFGGFYSGSPYLGALGSLPPGEGGLNPGAGFAYMWHSHTERELVNNDVFPGGMMTMLIVEARWVPID